MERRRRIAIGLGVLVLVAGIAPRPNADLRIDLPGTGTRNMRGAVDLGILGVSVLVTWGAERLR